MESGEWGTHRQYGRENPENPGLGLLYDSTVDRFPQGTRPFIELRVISSVTDYMSNVVWGPNHPY